MTLVDHAEPLTFEELAARFNKLGMTPEKYKAFKLPLSFEDITNPALSSEIVGYRRLLALYAHGRRRSSRSAPASVDQ
jgi:hypothetical protein